MKSRSIIVKGTEVSIASRHEQDYIALTDMVKNFDGGDALIEQWLKNKDTVLFLGVWEQLNNPDFNSLEFEGIRNEAGRNSFFLSAKKWIEATGAVGLYAKAGRYGGTYAHKDIAFEFGSWLSPEFKLYLIKEFQRLKDEESRTMALSGISSAPWPRSTTKATRDAVQVTIENFLWDDRTGLPTPAYSEEDVKTKSRDVYRHVHRVYPTIPSPFYAS